MDAPLTFTGLMTDFNSLFGTGDFTGAEELLEIGLGQFADKAAFFHFQFGRLYQQWNKLTSATNHLYRAIDLSGGDETLRVQILDELRRTREQQLLQQP